MAVPLKQDPICPVCEKPIDCGAVVTRIGTDLIHAKCGSEKKLRHK